jgi:hypothetical protein
MRQRWAVIAGLGILLASAGAWAQEASSTPGLVVLSERSDRPAPTIVRGTPRERAAARAGEGAQRLQIVGGKRLWLVDRATAEVRSCINRDTSTVGLRVVECTSAELGRYRRTFGASFQP